MIKSQDLVKIGKFQKTHALQGELNALLEIPEDYLVEDHPLIMEIEGIFIPFYVENIRKKGSESYLIKIEGLSSETEAKKFVNKTIYAIKSSLQDYLSEEEMDLIDDDYLIGYKVIDINNNTAVGIIKYIDNSTSNTLFFLDDKNGGEILLPANEELIRKIDDEAKEILMTLPDGLLEMNQ